jgi:glycosyltransferase involved in cell wall biosynthesis
MTEVSVIMPAYNASAYITDSIKSVLAQSITDFELIIIDDCSTDKTMQICEQFSEVDKRIVVLKTTKNFGCPGGPRNLGIKYARSKWIAFLDSDDIWHPDKLRLQIGLSNIYNAKFCSSEIVRYADGNTPQFKTDYPKPEVRKISFLSQLFNYQTPTSSVIVCSKTIKEHLFQDGVEFKAREDIDCWLRIHRSIRTSIKICYPLVGYRLNPNQISRSKLKMISKTYYCFSRTRAFRRKVFGLFPAILTLSHFMTSTYKRFRNRSI